jgi:hypothetical protein
MNPPNHHRHGRLSRLFRVAALVVTAAVLVAQSPGASPSGPGPATPEPPPSQLAVPTATLFPLPSVDPLDQRSGRGAPIEPPADIVGAWYSGTVSDIGYVDPNTGSYSQGGATGLAYTFNPDGSWESGFLMTSQLYNCAMRVHVYRAGNLVATDPATHIVDLDALVAQMHSEDSCVNENNYDRQLSPDDETLIWERTTDEYGDVLLLRGPDTQYTAFRPMSS